ncbi:D-xylose-proton symporter 3 [Spatholobus suberectus]|nr:D-xylose-proton symporter 3 [Spatholobus suberectus]
MEKLLSSVHWNVTANIKHRLLVPCVGLLADSLGRKRQLIVVALMYVFGGVITACEPELGVLLAGMLLYGLGPLAYVFILHHLTSELNYKPRMGLLYILQRLVHHKSVGL